MIPELYHWSPTYNRGGISRRGLVPGRKSVDGFWRPPYTCLAETPLWAWKLSGHFHKDIKAWDLWQISLSDGHDIRFRDDDDDKPEGLLHYEWRVYDRIYKRGIQFIGMRDNV